MENFIKKRILETNEKMISYAEFMSMALYDPDHGYYMKDGIKIGREGDFITTSNISDVYGRLVAKWYGCLVNKHGLTPAICEMGAGNGRFAKAFIDEWTKEVRFPLEYFIVETSPFHKQLQKEILGNNVIQLNSLIELQSFSGLVFSNELFDALPVRVIEKRDGQLLEVMIKINDKDDLVETCIPLEDEEITAFLNEHQFVLNDQQRLEIPLQMVSVIKDIASILTKGIVLTIDYGYTNAEWMEPIHRDGSLRGYYKHQLETDVLKYPGEMDLTSHMHFDAFIKQGEKYGLIFRKKLRQDQFLLSCGILQELQDHFDPNPFSEQSKRNRAIRSLIMPSGMSSYFHAIIQQKNIQLGENELFPKLV